MMHEESMDSLPQLVQLCHKAIFLAHCPLLSYQGQRQHASNCPLFLLCGLIRSVLGDVDTGIVADGGDFVLCIAQVVNTTEVGAAADFCGKEGQKCKAHPATLSRAGASTNIAGIHFDPAVGENGGLLQTRGLKS